MTEEETRRAEEAFEGFPIISKEGDFQPTLNAGGTRSIYNLPSLNKNNFDEYIEMIKNAGFTLTDITGEGVNNKTRGAVFRRGKYTYIVRGSSSASVTASDVNFDPAFSKEEVFIDFPEYEDSMEMGRGHYVHRIDNVSSEDLDSIRTKILSRGYRITNDFPEGVNNEVTTTRYEKDRHTVLLTYSIISKEVHLIFTMDEIASPFLFKDPDYKKKQIPGKQVTLYAPELWCFGECYVIQLKNGHFLVSDGGFPDDLPYLMDYLEEHAPKGEKPIIDAWFITHGHGDHIGIFMWLNTKPEYYDRIICNGVYYSWPKDLVFCFDPGTRDTMYYMTTAVSHLQTEKGEKTPFYRPHVGERYYFDDITMDIVETQEVLPCEYYSGDYNDSSTWYLITIEGQKLLFTGDGDKGGFGFITRSYSPSIGKVDFFTSLHHGHNTREDNALYFDIQTLLAASRYYGPDYRREWNDLQMSRAKEVFPNGFGARIFTFPYKLGESVLLPKCDWKYHVGCERMREKPFTRLIREDDGKEHLKIWLYRWIRPVREISVPVYSKSFVPEKEIYKAEFVITATGVYECLLNGKPLDDYLLAPGRTESRYVQCKSIQIKDLLTVGKENVFTVTVGEGFYHIDKDDIKNMESYDSRTEKALLLELRVTYTDGTMAYMGTDSTWTCREGIIRKASLFDGETIDFTAKESEEIPCEAFDGPILASTHLTSNNPPKRAEILKPISAERSGNTVRFDFGRDVIGFPRLTINGKAGDTFLLTDDKGKEYKVTLNNGENTAEWSLTYGTFRTLTCEGSLPEDAKITAVLLDKDPANRGDCHN